MKKYNFEMLSERTAFFLDMKLNIILISAFLLVQFVMIGQEANIGFSSSYGYQFVASDIADKYSNNSNLSVNLNYKSKTNWTIGAEAQYLFGSKYLDKNYLGTIVTTGGFVLGNGLTIEGIDPEGKGGNFYVEGGKIFSLSKNNLNSGIHIKGGLGYMFYYIYSNADPRLYTQLSEKYVDGYIRLENGISLNGYIGYTYYSRRNLFNGSLGLAIMNSFTKYDGTIDFATGKAFDQTSFTNIFFGPKATFTILLKRYKNASTGADGYYYN